MLTKCCCLTWVPSTCSESFSKSISSYWYSSRITLQYTDIHSTQLHTFPSDKPKNNLKNHCLIIIYNSTNFVINNLPEMVKAIFLFSTMVRAEAANSLYEYRKLVESRLARSKR